MGAHLEPVPPGVPDGHADPYPDDPYWDEPEATLERPPWWRAVAIVVVIALVAATPFAYALSVILR